MHHHSPAISPACPGCGKPLPGSTVAGLCARCVLRLVTEPAGEVTETRAVLGDYELLGEIGRGGMGVIYRARQRRLDREVAVKVLRGGEFASVEAQARFRSEAAAVARLQHPGIVAIHDVGEDAGVLWFSMDLVPGENLAERVSEHPLEARSAAECVRRVAEAVQHAHAHGVLHRDLKPSNILLGADGQPCVTDFGLARRTGADSASGAAEITRTGQMLGSPGYAAPEQALGGAADVRTDVYGLGALLYHLLTGRPPFQGPTLDSILLQLRDDDPLAPRRLTPTVPRDLETIALQCLEKNPAQRYRTAREVAEDLARFLEGERIRARPASSLDKAWRRCRRRPGVAALLALLVSGAAVAFAAIDSARREEGDAKKRAQAASAQAQTANTELSRANNRLAASVDLAEMRHADDLFREGDSAQAVGALALVLRHDPENSAACSRLASALWHGDFALPLAQPFFVGGEITHLQFLADGRTMFVGADAGAALWDAANGRKLRDFEPAQRPPGGYRLSVDEQTLAGWTADPNAFLDLWDVPGGQRLVPSIRHANWLNNLAFSPDSGRFIAVGGDPAPQLAEARTGLPSGVPLAHPFGQFACAFSQDGKQIATSERATVHVWDSATQQHLRTLPALPAAVKSIVFSPDGRWLAASDFERDIALFSMPGGEPASALRHHEPGINSIVFSRDDRHLLTSSDDHTAQVWEVPGGAASIPPLRHRDAVVFAAFSPDDARIVTCSSDNTARLWETRTGRPLSQPLRHAETPRLAVFTPDGATLYTGGADRTVRRWDARGANVPPVLLAHEGRVNSAEWSPDGTRIVTAGDDCHSVVWDAATARPNATRLPHNHPVRIARFSSDGRCFATGSDSRTAWVKSTDADTSLAGPLAHGGSVRDVAFSPNGQRLATGCADGTVRLWDLARKGALTASLPHAGAVRSVRFSPDGHLLLTAAFEDRAAHLWDAATGEPVASTLEHGDGLWLAEFSPDGALIATASHDNTARVWDARNGRPVSPWLRHARAVRSLDFSPDCRLIATASSDATARVWDARTGTPVTSPLVHDDHVIDVRFSPDGRRLATASRDKAARLWAVATGLPISEPLRHGGGVIRVRFSPDGQRLLTVSGENVARIWDVPDFTGPAPTWMIELAEALSLTDAPHEPADALTLLAHYRQTMEQARATPAGTAFSRLALRLFGHGGQNR